MKSNIKKRVLAVVLCMVLMLSTGISTMADGEVAAGTPAPESGASQEPAAASVEGEAVEGETVEGETVEGEQTPAEQSTETQEETPTEPSAAESKDEPAADINSVSGVTELVGSNGIQNEASEQETETDLTEQEPEPEVEIVSEATELKQEFTDEAGNVTQRVIANIPEGAFQANASEITMEVNYLDEAAENHVKELMTAALPENEILGDYILYDIKFKVNGEVAEPQKAIAITFEGSGLHIEDTKKANVFYIDPADPEVQDDKDEIVEITQKSEMIENLQNAGQSVENIDEYDLSEISVKEDGTADQILMEGRISTVYGCYVEEYPEPVQTLTYEDDDVVVNVNAYTEDAIPAGASLKVVPIRADDKETEEQYKEVEDQLNKKAESEDYDIAGFLAYDISFINENGEEVEPSGDVKVTIEYKGEVIPEGVEGDSNLDVTVMHLEENSEGNVEKVVDIVADTDKEAIVETTDAVKVKKAEFVTDRFSAMAITWLENSKAATAKVSITDNILTDGSLKAVLSGGISTDYQWSKSDNRNGTYTNVDKVQYQGGVSNISSDGTNLYPAFDEGARKWYKVTVTFSNGTKATSNPIQVKYYNELQNGSFEYPKSNGHDNETSGNRNNGAQWSNEDYAEAGGVWQTTGMGSGETDGQDIEVLWIGSKGNKSQFTNHSQLTAADGEQFAEINCEAAGALYQEVLTVPGTELNYLFYHRARDCGAIKYRYPNTGETKYDTMYLVIAPATDVQNCNTQSQLTTYLKSNGVTITNGAQKVHSEVSNILKDEDGLLVVEITSDSSDWRRIVGQYTPTSSLTRFFFVSGATAANNNTIGNFVDKISFTQDLPPVDEDEFSLEIEKKFKGLDNQALTELQNKIQFKISAERVNGNELTENEVNELFGTTTIDGVDMRQYPDGSLHYSIKNQKIGTEDEYKVTITEQNAELSGYELTSVSATKVTIGDEEQITTGSTDAVISSLKGKTTASIVFTNTYNRSEVKKINFKKIWDDKDNAFGTRPESLDVMLKASIVVEEDGNITEKFLDEYTQTATLTADNDWKTSWEVPVYYDYEGVKVKINYTVQEGEITSDYVYQSPSGGAAQVGTGKDYVMTDFGNVTVESDTEPKTSLRRMPMSSSALNLDNVDVTAVNAVTTSDGSNLGLGEPAHKKYIDYNENTSEYTLNLDVKGAKGTTKGADILFVIDTSGSMGGNYSNLLSKLKSMLTQEDGIIDRIFKTEGNVNSVAYVSFAGKTQTTASSWYQTSGKETLKSNINSLRATGGTNWTYALQQASSLLAKKNNSDNEKVVIFLSDGKPTYTMDGNSQTGNGSDTRDSYYGDAANVVNKSSSLSKAKMYSVYLTSGTKSGMKTFSEKVNNSELVDGTDLQTALDKILNKVIPTYKNVVITDTLSDYVEFAELDPTIVVTKETAAGVKTTLGSDDYDAVTTANTVKVSLLKGQSLDDGATYTVSFKIKPSDKANEEYGSSGRYNATGDSGTGITSSGKEGFYSNDKTQTKVEYQVNGQSGTGSALYPMPVVQVTTHQLSYTKEWKYPNGVVEPIGDVTLHVVYTDGTKKDIILRKSEGYKTIETVPITKKISSITEDPVDGYTASYQVTDNGTNALITNSYSKVKTSTIEVKKKWIGGSLHNPVQVSLYQSVDGEDAIRYDTVTLSETNDWKHTWEGLPESTGTVGSIKEYEYAVREENIPANYSSDIVYDSEGDKTTVTITNTYDSNCTDEDYYIANVLQTETLYLEKDWNDSNDILGKRPNVLGVKVTGGEKDLMFYLTSAGSWKRTVTLLKRVGVTYSAEEILGSAGDIYELENINIATTEEGTTFSFSNKLKTKSIIVQKDWNDNDISTRPESISFTLQYKKDSTGEWQTYDNYNMTAEDIVNDSPWSMVINNLPATYEYRVAETNVATGYNTEETISGDTYTITNTLKWKVRKTSTPIGDKDAEPLSDAEFELKKDSTVIATGKSTEDGSIVWTLSEDSAVDLNKLDGKYTICETRAPAGYVLSGDWTLEFSNGLLTTLDGKSVKDLSNSIDGVVVTITNDAIYELPGTGGSGIYWYSIGGMLLMMAAALILYRNKCREVLES